MINTEDLNLKLFEDANKQFKNHLLAENNNRIIFSGKFGHGKTTFLKWFFNQEEQKKKYNVIRLFPVNYSVASNEDIFEYIKYDIITEMLRENYKVTDIGTYYFETLPFFLAKNPLKVIALLVSMIPKVGKDISDVAGKLDDLVKEFKAYHKKHANNTNEINQLTELIEKLQEKEGSVYESNAITKLIELLLNRQREISNAKETILLIDDLDRIDPEHIFRILNVFAAHFDIYTSDNKFGFDKVIVVCDIDNIRNIFKAKYGMNTDFNGYVDKFYSHKVFVYNIKKYFFRFISSKLDKASWMLEGAGLYSDSRYIGIEKQSFFNNNSLLFNMLSILVDNNQVDLRNTNKWNYHAIDYSYYTSFGGKVILESIENIYVVSIRLLSHLKGDSKALKDAISSINEFKFNAQGEYIEACKVLTYIMLINRHQKAHGSYSFSINDNDFIFKISEIDNKTSIVSTQKNIGEINALRYKDFKEIFIRVIDLLGTNNQL